MRPVVPLYALLAVAATLAGCVKLERPPIELSFRDSLLGAGMIVRLENASNEALAGLAVEIESPSGETRTFALDRLGGYDTFEIGWKKLGGWEVPPGAEVRVRADGYLLAVVGSLPVEEPDP